MMWQVFLWVGMSMIVAGIMMRPVPLTKYSVDSYGITWSAGESSVRLSWKQIENMKQEVVVNVNPEPPSI